MTLLRRNGALLLTSFLLSGLVNVHAQAFFAANVPAAKERWLAGCLLVGTVASIAAVRLSRRFGFLGGGVRAGTLLVLSMLALSVVVLGARGPWLYAAAHVGVRAVANYVTQEMDRRATALAGAARARNDQLGSALRFVGMLLGPLWLGAVSAGAAQARVALWNGCALAVLGALALAACRAVGSGDETWQPAEAPRPLSRSGRAVWSGALAIYGAYALLASSAVYVLRDLHGRADATVMGSALIATVYASAIVSTVVIGLCTREGLAPSWMRVAPVVMALAGALLGTEAAGATPVLFGSGVVLGVAFALFMLAFREHATRRAAAGEPEWLVAFNNLGNSGALVGFGAMAALVGLGSVWPGNYGVRLGEGLVALSAAALWLSRGRAPHEETVPQAVRP
ncbi:MAG TPA: hypothetical protein VFZ09_01630 [Archangium sp.]|uniref:hypothetical protein n=1 Tax=Archangium sp. TaxID=1872627 RepID=UPI002E2EBF43|nr:hypothetical protein [Archangium sp.]HEX5744911.1 hypothetical protein [Archangium sp.]